MSPTVPLLVIFVSIGSEAIKERVLPKLDNADIRFNSRTIKRDHSHTLNPVLNRIHNVWNNLHGLAQIVTLSLTVDNIEVNLAGSDVVITSQSQ